MVVKIRIFEGESYICNAITLIGCSKRNKSRQIQGYQIIRRSLTDTDYSISPLVSIIQLLSFLIAVTIQKLLTLE